MFTPPAFPLFVATCLLVNTTRIPTTTPARHVIAPALLMERKHTPVRNTGTTTPGENRAEWDGRNLGTKWVMYLVRAHAHFLSFSRDSLLDYYE